MTRKTLASIGITVAGVVAAAGIIAFATFQVGHYARASDGEGQIKINEDAIARVVELTVGLADRAEAEDAATEAKRETLRSLCLGRQLKDREKCASVGVELP